MDKRKHSFSLIELLVVVFIISVLIAIVIPGLRRVHEKALMTRCQNNLRQYGTALGQYMADWNGYFIWTGKGKSGGGGSPYASIQASGDNIVMAGNPNYNWQQDADQIEGDYTGKRGAISHNYWNFLPYISDVEARHCPSVDWKSLISTNSSEFKGYQDAGSDELLDDIYYISNTTYAINNRCQGLHMSEIPSDVIAFVDWNAAEGWKWCLYSSASTWPTWQFSNTNKGIVQGESKGTTNWCKTEVGFHHLGGANYVAMDGHVGWVSSNDITYSNFYY